MNVDIDPAVRLTEDRLTAGLDAALNVLEARGIPRSHVLIGITSGVEEDDGTPYETHVGRTGRQSLSVLLSIVSKDLQREAQQQAVYLVSPAECCPVCESPRFGTAHERREPRPAQGPGVYVAFFGQCMDCGHRTIDR